MASRIMDTPLTVTAGDLLGVAPGVREEIKKSVTKRQMKEVEAEVAKAFGEVEQNELQSYNDLYDEEEGLTLPIGAVNICTLPLDKAFILPEDRGSLPMGAISCGDPVLQLLDTLAPGEMPDIFVAKEADSRRTIHPNINGSGTRECVLDGGSQIVSMDKEVAMCLGITCDPDIHIYMQSANKSVEKTEGLSKNVLFLFNDITLYMQVHIIKNPAYDVLLGRPFDTLTKSSIQNATDGRQTITITDPNSGRRCTLPMYTYKKSRSKSVLSKTKEEQNFQDSMN
jgi:hypothetical protein